jgi:hypothetical protein
MLTSFKFPEPYNKLYGEADLSGFSNLEFYDFSNNYLTKVIFNNNSKLTTINIMDNDSSINLQLINLNSLSNLQTLNLTNSKLSNDKLDLSDNLNLQTLYLKGTDIKEVILPYDLKNFKYFETDLSNNQIKVISRDQSFFQRYQKTETKLELGLFNFKGTLDFSSFSNLQELYINGNNQDLKVIDVRSNFFLSNLIISNTSITKLDLTQNMNLKNIILTNNPNLKEINLPPCNSTLEQKNFVIDNSSSPIIKRNSYHQEYEKLNSQ